MKVLCTKDLSFEGRAAPKAGQVYTVINTVKCPCGLVWYTLAEVLNPSYIGKVWCTKCLRDVTDWGAGWWSKWFVPLDNPSIRLEDVHELYRPSPMKVLWP